MVSRRKREQAEAQRAKGLSKGHPTKLTIKLTPRTSVTSSSNTQVEPVTVAPPSSHPRPRPRPAYRGAKASQVIPEGPREGPKHREHEPDVRAAASLLDLARNNNSRHLEDMVAGNKSDVEEGFMALDGNSGDEVDILNSESESTSAAKLPNFGEFITICQAISLLKLTADTTDIPDDEDDPVFQIPLQVPVGGALDNVELPSDTSWMAFRVMVSNKMDIPESKLDLAYKLSNEPKGDLPHCLSTAKHLLQLITAASQHFSGTIKSRSKKPFYVVIIDKSPKDTAKKNGNKGKCKVSCAGVFLS